MQSFLHVAFKFTTCQKQFSQVVDKLSSRCFFEVVETNLEQAVKNLQQVYQHVDTTRMLTQGCNSN